MRVASATSVGLASTCPRMMTVVSAPRTIASGCEAAATTAFASARRATACSGFSPIRKCSSTSTGDTSNGMPAARNRSARRGDAEASTSRIRHECYDEFVDSLHTVVPRALTELFRHGPMSQGKLEVAWRVAVGDALTRVTSVRLQPDGVVEVHPADQRWHKELKRSSSMMI